MERDGGSHARRCWELSPGVRSSIFVVAVALVIAVPLVIAIPIAVAALVRATLFVAAFACFVLAIAARGCAADIHADACEVIDPDARRRESVQAEAGALEIAPGYFDA